MLERRSDRDLKQRILRELKWDSRVSWASINVEVTNGVVTLVGTVLSYAQAIAAQEAAHRVAGVLDVVNEKQLREEIEFALERRALRWGTTDEELREPCLEMNLSRWLNNWS